MKGAMNRKLYTYSLVFTYIPQIGDSFAQGFELYTVTK